MVGWIKSEFNSKTKMKNDHVEKVYHRSLSCHKLVLPVNFDFICFCCHQMLEKCVKFEKNKIINWKNIFLYTINFHQSWYWLLICFDWCVPTACIKVWYINHAAICDMLDNKIFLYYFQLSITSIMPVIWWHLNCTQVRTENFSFFLN